MASECTGASSRTKNVAVQRDTSRAEDPKGVDVCPFFLEGKCHFGARCRMAHSSTRLICEVTSTSKKKANRNKTAKAKENEAKGHFDWMFPSNVNKKPRMRTADDVISRILWDPSADASQFVVGYVDRYLGVLERPFCDFNWDTNPCDCDYATELALPRHRIQYFTYRGHRVWDRHSRTDRVFGSTGQSLAPPFGGEEECTDAENTHLQDDKHSEMNARTSESAQAGQASTKIQLYVTCVASHSSCHGIVSHFHAPESLKQSEENRGRRPPKKKPTHFITFRANTPAILASFQQLQEEVSALLPSSAPHWQASASLHVTLCLLVLRGPAEVEAAVEILRRFAHLDRNPPVAVSFPVKLKHFNGRVLYLSPQPQLQLQQLNGGLQEAYRSEGLLHRDSYNPRYHLTLAKVTDKDGERIFDGVGDLKVGKGLHFGRLPVNSLHLCVVGGADVDGFFETVCTVSLR
uniref:Leukocyte receptor cluster member 9 n=1 Tax=Hippocampus comes TaxID=109280 RepID=A0A3Q2Z8R5_HIPCM